MKFQMKILGISCVLHSMTDFNNDRYDCEIEDGNVGSGVPITSLARFLGHVEGHVEGHEDIFRPPFFLGRN